MTTLPTVPLGIVIHDDKVLLVNRRFPPLVWGPPGGFVDKKESLAKAAEREVFEETGIVCEAINTIIDEFEAYDTHVVLYPCKYISGDLRCSYESKDVGWFKLDDLPSPLSPKERYLEMALDIVNSNNK